MKAFKVIYKNGHFIDTQTKQRIIPVQNKEYIISGEDSNFLESDNFLSVEPPLTPEQKEKWAESEYGLNRYHKILNKGEKLFFRIGNSKVRAGDGSQEYVFTCELLEDLYIYLLTGKDSFSSEHWRLAECQCILSECILGNVTLSEKIKAKSLNKLFTNTVQFYFSMQRSSSTNVFDTFYPKSPEMAITFDAIRNKAFAPLNSLRTRFVCELIEARNN